MIEDTIASISSPPGGSPRGIVRLSGPEAFALAFSVFEPQETGSAKVPQGGAWAGFQGRVPGPQGTQAPARLLLMSAPRSYTRQDVAEIHTLGAVPLLNYLLGLLVRRGARLAEPGEFTLRAFLNGRIDLSQAEAVAALIEAADKETYRRAQRALEGRLGAELSSLRRRIVEVRAELESVLNFPEEEDVRGRPEEEVKAELRNVAEHLERLSAGRVLQEEYPRIVLAGRTNAGKSTLFNALLGCNRAVVHHVEGTTADAVTATLQLGGITCVLVDTAGTEGPEDPVQEAAAAVRAKEIQNADIVLGVVDATRPDYLLLLQELRCSGNCSLLAATKADLLKEPKAPQDVLLVSGKTGYGIERLKSALAAVVAGANGGFVVSAHQKEAAGRAHEALKRAERLLGQPELCCVELRSAEQALGEILGEEAGADLLGVIFSRFCIGK